MSILGVNLNVGEVRSENRVGLIEWEDHGVYLPLSVICLEVVEEKEASFIRNDHRISYVPDPIDAISNTKKDYWSILIVEFLTSETAILFLFFSFKFKPQKKGVIDIILTILTVVLTISKKSKIHCPFVSKLTFDLN